MMTRRSKLGSVASLLWMATFSACVCAGAQTTSTQPSAAQQPKMKEEAGPTMPTVVGEPLDRVVAIVNGDLILDSDVNEEQRFEAIQSFRQAEDRTRNKAIERLINRQLILQQAKLQPEDPISDADIDKEIDQLRANLPDCKQYGCGTKAGWEKFLAAQGFTEASFRTLWAERMEVLRFIEERFKQGVRISDADVKSYFEKTMLPEYAKRGVTPPKLETVANRIQEVLLEQQVSILLNDWLTSLRAQGQVVILHPGESAP